MTPDEAAEAHIAETVSMSRDTPWGSDGVAFGGAHEYAAAVRAQMTVFLRSVDEYVGLSLDAARGLADWRGDRLCPYPVRGHRASLNSRRIHVLVVDGTVTAARLDRPHWLVGVVEGPGW